MLAVIAAQFYQLKNWNLNCYQLGKGESLVYLYDGIQLSLSIQRQEQAHPAWKAEPGDDRLALPEGPRAGEQRDAPARPGWAPGRMATTQFKKGRPAQEARNYVPIGTEKYDSKRKVTVRKITDDPAIFPAMRWRPVHVLVWETANGPIPKGHIVVFKKGLKTLVSADITVDRLDLVTLAENMRRNSYRNYPQPIPQLIQLRGALNRKINKRERKKA